MFTVTEDFPHFQLVKLSGLIFFPNSLALLRVDLTKSKDTQQVGNEWVPPLTWEQGQGQTQTQTQTHPVPSPVTKRAPRGGAVLGQGEPWCCLTPSRSQCQDTQALLSS